MAVVAIWGALAPPAAAQPGGLPPVVFPPENPFSESKRVLGKILFWDEQLSSDNTMACGTCHIPGRSGTDPRVGINPGLDGVPNTPDDKRGSPGMVHQNEMLEYEAVEFFNLAPQVGTRKANSAVMAMYAPELFWDGRASTQFVDPQTGETAIALGGALESQAVGPVMNVLEMAHTGRDWEQVREKLQAARPLALATDLPPDMASAVAVNSTYPGLFEAAFGDTEITAARIGMAIATYERTLVPDQTPWDLFVAGNPNAMTPQQVNGWNLFRTSRCATCHAPPQFTDNTFRNVGLRPIPEDRGRQDVTGNPADRGRFKVPSLRGVGLNVTHMHTGQFNNIGQVLGFYAAPNPLFPDNRDPVLSPPIAFGPGGNDVISFITNGLTDPRVAGEQFPFDRPTLHSQVAPANPRLQNGGTPGSGGFVPAMVANMPPLIGDASFKIGIDRGLAGANAWLAISETPPTNGQIARDQLLGPITLSGLLAGEGYGTMPLPIPNDATMDGFVYFAQWIVEDPAGVNGEALSRIARVTYFCGSGGCGPVECRADINGDGELDFFDALDFLELFSNADPGADFTNDGELNFFDIQEFLEAFSIGCP